MSGLRTVALTASVSRMAGGPFESVRGLARGLVSAGVGVEVLGLRDSFTDEDIGAWAPLKPQVFKPLSPVSFGFVPGYLEALMDAAPDIVHCHGIWMYPSLASLRWHGRTGRPYVVSAHGMLDPWAVRHHGWRKGLVSLLFQRRHLCRAACLRALTRSELGSMRACGLRNPVCVIPNGIELTDGLTGVGGPSWPGEFTRGRKVLLYLGRLHPKKNIAALLQAWSMARAEVPRDEWRLVVAGWDQSGHREELERLAVGLRIGDEVHFAGPCFGADKAAALGAAAGFVLPSLSEGLPIAVLEAWAARLPVLHTAYCNLPEGAAAGAAIETGTSAPEIADGLRSLFGMSDTERVEMGARGRVLVEQRFTWARVAADMAQVYDWLMGRASRPASVELE